MDYVYQSADNKIFMLFGISNNYVLCTERERKKLAREGERIELERGRCIHCEVIRRGKNVTEGDFCSTGAIPKNTLSRSPTILFFSFSTIFIFTRKIYER